MDLNTMREPKVSSVGRDLYSTAICSKSLATFKVLLVSDLQPSLGDFQPKLVIQHKHPGWDMLKLNSFVKSWGTIPFKTLNNK